jgi:hypothetical protein
MPPTPNADNLLLGAGSCFFAPFRDDGQVIFRHLGNCEALEETTTDDPLIKRESMTKARSIYKKTNRGRDVVLRVVADEFNAENMALFTMGDVAYTTQAATAVTDRVLATDVDTIGTGTLGEVLGDKYFYVGALLIGTATMKLGAATLSAADWEVFSATMGIVKILSTSTHAVTAGDDLKVSFTPTAITGTDAPIVRGGTQSEIEGSFLYVADNASGPNGILRAWHGSITPDGALGLISDEYATMALNITLLSDAQGLHGGSASDPLYHIQYLPDAA